MKGGLSDKELSKQFWYITNIGLLSRKKSLANKLTQEINTVDMYLWDLSLGQEALIVNQISQY